MISIIRSDSVITHQSKSLRGITAHSHRHGKPQAVITAQHDGSAQCYLRWPNGDTSHFSFASAQEWFTRAASRVTFYPYEELS